jgi:hypothetical protein
MPVEHYRHEHGLDADALDGAEAESETGAAGEPGAAKPEAGPPVE